MTFAYPSAPEGHFFKIKRFTDEWSGDTFWILQLRKKTFIFSLLEDAVFLEDVTREDVAQAATTLLERREAATARISDVRAANKILRGKDK